ncbi:MAG TPA: MerR family transcriptional regulator [Candidatus Binataceae bacterium]|nr:MerR family transcriptional regulator [Candidatus Binataceae bacterium]
MARASSKPAARKPRRANSTPTDDRPLKIGEAARLLGVEAYVLRFWETQFSFLKPHHASSSHRMYRPRDIELLQLVKKLLHVEGYTIAGAKKHIREVGLDKLCAGAATPEQPKSTPEESETPVRPPPGTPAARNPALAEIRSELESLRRLLDEN